jgi:predicted enzyme related to lactoylglutathione lyase
MATRLASWKGATMKDEAMKHGAFGWRELKTTDPRAAAAFYTTLFGWETVDYPMEGMTYTVLKVNGDETGGIMGIPPKSQGMPPMWSIYVTVDDVDATAKQVEELGGKILQPPIDIPMVGRFCVLQDPQGAAICAITYAKKPE